MKTELRIGLALSGGGSRAIAFHLGCMRALEKSGILEKVEVLSSVSGGSMVAALYAYWDDSFDDFEKRVKGHLRKGFLAGIARHTLLSPHTFAIIATIVSSGLAFLIGSIIRVIGIIFKFVHLPSRWLFRLADVIQSSLPRHASRSTAFERYLRHSVFQDKRVDEVGRNKLQVLINATEMRTGTAFRFGSEKTGTWRYGVLSGDQPLVSKAVSASAAYPGALPAFDEKLLFHKGPKSRKHRVITTDGGVYDNLGIMPFLPDRSAEHSSHAYDVDYIICCDASAGQLDGEDITYDWPTRMLSTVNTIHRRTHVLSYKILHNLKQSNAIKGFIMPYLGQQDDSLPIRPPNFVTRKEVVDYPTDFNSMSERDIQALSQRGEQLTTILIDNYFPKND